MKVFTVKSIVWFLREFWQRKSMFRQDIFDPCKTGGLPLFIEEEERFESEVFGERLSFLSVGTRVKRLVVQLTRQLPDKIVGSTVEP